MTHVFVAPHPDDVALSCGGLIASLRELGQTVTIVTVFSGAGTASGADGGPLTSYQREALGFGSKAVWPVTEGFNRAHIAADFPVYGDPDVLPAWAATDARLEATQSDADAAAKRFWQRSSWYRRANIHNESLAGQPVIDDLPTQGAVLTDEVVEAAAAGEIERVERHVADDPTSVIEHSADGWTPLHLAAFFGHPRIVELLLGGGADVTARSRNSNGNTPLHAALAANRKIIAGLLIGVGADVNAVDAQGWRPLHLAAANDNIHAAKALIAEGADIQAQNGAGQTALSLAQEKNHREMAALLRRHGG